MSKEELVRAYVDGQISRRVFIRRLISAGLSVGAAFSYASLLSPARATAQGLPPDYGDYGDDGGNGRGRGEGREPGDYADYGVSGEPARPATPISDVPPVVG